MGFDIIGIKPTMMSGEVSTEIFRLGHRCGVLFVRTAMRF